MKKVLVDKKKKVKNKTEKGIPFVVTFQPRLIFLEDIVEKNFFYFT